MKTNEIFKLVIRQKANCTLKGRMPNYAVMIGSYKQPTRYNILSYASAFSILRSPNSTDFLSNDSNNLSVKRHTVHLFDTRTIRGEAPESCVTKAIACLFPYSCILSDDNDPLLKRIMELYEVLLDIYQHSLPSAKQSSITNVNNLKPFDISKSFCYWYSKCFGMETDLNTTATNIRRTAFNEMRLQGSRIQNELQSTNIESELTCNPFVFLCYASGTCATFLYSKLLSELQDGLLYMRKRLNFVTMGIHDSKFKADFPDILFNQTNKCEPVYLYGDTTGRFTVEPKEYAEWLTDILQIYYNNFESFTYGFSEIFMENTKWANFCPGEVPISCLTLRFWNKVMYDILKRISHPNLTRDKFVMDIADAVFLPYNERVVRSLKTNEYYWENLQVEQHTSSYVHENNNNLSPGSYKLGGVFPSGSLVLVFGLAIGLFVSLLLLKDKSLKFNQSKTEI